MAVLTYEDKIIIRYLRQKHGHGARRIVADHPEKDWKISTLSDLVKKIDETGEIERKKGSGRPRSARTEHNIECTEEMICSQEDQPGENLIEFLILRFQRSVFF